MHRLVSSLLLCSLVVVITEAQAAVPGDFDQDGISDLVQVEKTADGSFKWRATSSSTGLTSELGTLGKDSDTPAMAQWLGQGAQIGVVAEGSADSSGLVWSIRGVGGAIVEKQFGSKGDVIISGADFNGNGTADAAVVRLVDGKAVWDIALDLFATGEAQPQQVTFGKRGDRVFFARIDDSPFDWIGTIGKGSRGRAQARFRNIVTGEIRRFNRMPRLAVSGNRPRPFAVRQSVGPDLLGFLVEKEGSSTISFFSLSGDRIWLSTFSGSGALAVGDFNSGAGYEVLFAGADSSFVVNPSAGEERALSGALYSTSSQVVDETAVAVVGLDPSAGTDSGGGSTGGGVSQCSSVVGWPGGHIYKTIGSEHFYDIRRNTIGIVIRPGGRGPFPSCVDAVDTAGNVVARLGLYARGSGWEARYYAGIGCGSAFPFNGAAVASKARSNTGSPQVYMNFDGVCYGPIDAGVCIGSSQC